VADGFVYTVVVPIEHEDRAAGAIRSQGLPHSRSELRLGGAKGPTQSAVELRVVVPGAEPRLDKALEKLARAVPVLMADRVEARPFLPPTDA
jgi:hypothetical protein